MKFNLIAVTLFISCLAAGQTKKSTYIFMLGKDTVGYEQYSRSPDQIEGDILTLSPKVAIAHFKAILTNNTVTNFTYYSAYPLSDAKIMEREISVLNDTSIKHTMLRNGKLDSFFTRSYSARPGSVPHFDFDISMYEQMVKEMIQSGKDSIPLDRLSNAPMRGFIKRTGANEYQGRVFGFPIVLKTDGANNIAEFDATASTIKLKAYPIAAIDFQKTVSRYSQLEKTRGEMGSLSFSDTIKRSFKGADFEVNYGRPLRRGRIVFGEIVPWNRVWRTGANFATHFSTSKDLVIGTFTVPAGRYTLWTLPDPDGAKLIINKSINIFGTQYNPRNDLVRLDMSKSDLTQMVEQLTIDIHETTEGGKLVIKWEQTAYSIDFKVNN